jgi:hypothetical protein
VNLQDCRLRCGRRWLHFLIFFASKKVQKTPKKTKKPAVAGTHGRDARATVFSGIKFFSKRARIGADRRGIKYLREKSARKRAGCRAMNGTKMTNGSACFEDEDENEDEVLVKNA